ncbi:MAG: D-aminoacylase [Bacteroidota bacterium]
MKNVFFYTLLIVCVACSSPQHYDVLIQNGTLYDGSGEAPIQADIALLGDTIAAMGALHATADVVIDAQGKAVSPGFINMLSWAAVSLLEDGRSQGDIRQGVTLEVMGEGRSMGPLSEDMKREMKESQGEITFDIPWTTLGEHLQYLEDKGVSTNVASFVGNGTLRRHVIGYENRPATAEELAAMEALTDEAMREGAVGISSALLYAPSRYASKEELIALSKVASKYDGMYISHIRSEGDQLIKSMEELIHIGREADIAAEVYHLKASGQKNWAKLDSAIALIEAARAEGLAITTDMYTYPASSTGLHVQLPEWVREGGVAAAIERLSTPSLRQRILKDIEFDHPPENILLVGFRNPALRTHVGKRLSEVAQELDKDPKETMMDLMVEDNSRIQVVYFSMSEENLRKKLKLPYMSFCSDAGSMSAEGVFLKQSTHPRAYGSFVRVLGKFSRDEGLLPLEEAIRKLSYLPAQNLKLKKRGLLKIGNYADVVVFDPQTVTDHATFEEPHQYATGVEQVFVNGEQVLKDGEHTGAMPGRFVKGPGYK